MPCIYPTPCGNVPVSTQCLFHTTARAAFVQHGNPNSTIFYTLTWENVKRQHQCSMIYAYIAQGKKKHLSVGVFTVW
ncbi:hypothetical protein IEQ34_016804 [Dendrobium chrysotoxum]|uniref:Uncharacterized protein n=1 Tax=Dendrobium chrysotoxum TaxID=161865 RepID=A0AAV7GGK7_DENCH|nr:hypothetical protein IEQ34_016804 [Dendrobium chrysotoxum]